MGAYADSRRGRLDKGEGMKARFASIAEEAAYENGHGGYSGTFAEKHDGALGFRVEATFTARQFDTLEALIIDGQPIKGYSERTGEAIPRKATKSEAAVIAKMGGSARIIKLHDLYEDKWGPAAFVVDAKRNFLVIGLCSS